jgi:hypothetical protein
MNESAELKIPQTPKVSRTSEEKAAILARCIIREGKTFKDSALAAGYAATTATLGLKCLMRESSIVAKAVERETKAQTIGIDKLKPLAVQRLYKEIINDKSPGGLKAIELAGRFKENDWFVKSSDVQVGVMAVLGDSQALDSAKNNIQAYIDSEPVEKQE